MNKNYYQTNSSTRNKILKRFSMFDGVGLDLTNARTFDDALVMAGLDYTAEKKPIFLADGQEIKDHFAVVKSDEPSRVLGVVGNQYQAVGNREAFAVAEEIVDEGYAAYEVGGPSFKAKNTPDFARPSRVCLAGGQYRVICQRVVCMNGMVRYLGGAKSQLRINIQHTATAKYRIAEAQKIIMQRRNEIEQIKAEATAFINQGMTRAEFEKEIIPLILREKKLVENDKKRERGHERIDTVVRELLQAYNADDVQNHANNAYRAILAISDYESHSAPLRDVGNGQVYMNRAIKGMVLTTAVAQYIAKTRGITVKVK